MYLFVPGRKLPQPGKLRADCSCLLRGSLGPPSTFQCRSVIPSGREQQFWRGVCGHTHRSSSFQEPTSFLAVLPPFALLLCWAPPLGKNSIFRSCAGMLHATDALQCWSFHTAARRHVQSLCPLLYRGLIHDNEVGPFFHAFHFIAEGDPHTIAQASVNGLLENFDSFLQTMCYRRYPGKVPASCSHPSSSQQTRQAVSLSLLSFL